MEEVVSSLQSTTPGAEIPVTSGRREPVVTGINAGANLGASVPRGRSLCDGSAIVSPGVPASIVISSGSMAHCDSRHIGSPPVISDVAPISRRRCDRGGPHRVRVVPCAVTTAVPHCGECPKGRRGRASQVSSEIHWSSGRSESCSTRLAPFRRAASNIQVSTPHLRGCQRSNRSPVRSPGAALSTMTAGAHFASSAHRKTGSSR